MVNGPINSNIKKPIYITDGMNGWELMKFTDENIQIQLAKNTKSGHKGKAKQSNEDIQNQLATNTKSGDKGKAKDSDEILLGEENMNIEIPRMLKKQLVDDSEFVTRLGKLIKLPRTPNVDDILKKYFSFKVKKNNIHPSSDMLSGNRLRDEIQEILYGIRYYFDKALPTMLLYNNERKQYETLSAENIPPSVAYGAEHLLRLFVKLPEILQDVNIEEEMRMKLEHEILGLIKKIKVLFSFLPTRPLKIWMQRRNNDLKLYHGYLADRKVDSLLVVQIMLRLDLYPGRA
ncbi:protein MRG2-like [Apium graveolens]|uniref:protein MRG2-like n=1 Tax=Apium graveolens TaxID=4045 RepID=UPI003D79A04A